MKSRPAFTLIEVIVVMTVLTVLMVLGVTLLTTAVRMHWVIEGTSNRIGRHRAAADTFREDVARATSMPDQLGQDTAGKDCLILQGDGPPIVYRVHDEKLIRTAGEQRHTLYPGGFVEFERGKNLAILRLREPPPRRPVIALEIMAALGGDRR